MQLHDTAKGRPAVRLAALLALAPGACGAHTRHTRVIHASHFVTLCRALLRQMCVKHTRASSSRRVPGRITVSPPSPTVASPHARHTRVASACQTHPSTATPTHTRVSPATHPSSSAESAAPPTRRPPPAARAVPPPRGPAPPATARSPAASRGPDDVHTRFALKARVRSVSTNAALRRNVRERLVRHADRPGARRDAHATDHGTLLSTARDWAQHAQHSSHSTARAARCSTPRANPPRVAAHPPATHSTPAAARRLRLLRLRARGSQAGRRCPPGPHPVLEATAATAAAAASPR